ncbi:tetratricopeptide repeat protein [Companilactobacillus sp. DQM5]|uniref:tetratricopeptide repeat protein n=1 Tax=Companilactobacillus sp. DQM5 TaxID=3463359 RepID=UPI004058571F
MSEISKEAERLYSSDKKQEAVILLTRSLSKDFEQLDLILQLSTYLTYGGEMQQAEELLLKSKNFFPNEKTIDYNLGNIYYTQGEYNKAIDVFNSIKTNDSMYMLAQCYQQLGDNNRALVYAITASENKNDEVYLELVGDILLSLGNIKQAKDYYQKSADIKENEKNTFNLALCLTVLNEKDAQKYFAVSKKINSKYYNDNIKRLDDIQKLISGKK